MTTVATHFTKFQVGAAAAAITAAAVLTPAAIAQARPDLMPTAPVTELFSTEMFGTDPILGPIQFSTENPDWWWLGDGGGTAQAGAVSTLALPGTTVFEFTPLSFVPGFLKPIAGWFLSLIPQFNICLGGLGVSVGPYGSLTVKTGAC